MLSLSLVPCQVPAASTNGPSCPAILLHRGTLLALFKVNAFSAADSGAAPRLQPVNSLTWRIDRFKLPAVLPVLRTQQFLTYWSLRFLSRQTRFDNAVRHDPLRQRSVAQIGRGAHCLIDGGEQSAKAQSDRWPAR